MHTLTPEPNKSLSPHCAIDAAQIGGHIRNKYVHVSVHRTCPGCTEQLHACICACAKEQALVTLLHRYSAIFIYYTKSFFKQDRVPRERRPSFLVPQEGVPGRELWRMQVKAFPLLSTCLHAPSQQVWVSACPPND